MRRVLPAYLVFSVMEWATWVALLVWAYDQRGVGGAATVSVAQLVPAIVVAPLAAAAGDRLRHGTALAVGYGAQAVAALATGLALATEQSFVVVLLGGVLLTGTITLTRPVHNAAMPELARTPAELTAGNAATSGAESVGTFLGPAASGLLIVAIDAEGVFTVFGILMLGSMLLVLRLPVSAEIRPAEHEGYLRSVTAGVTELRNEPSAAILLGTVASQYVVIGLLDILIVVLALDVLGTDDSGPGLLGGAFGVGCVLGALGSILLVGRRRLAPALVLALAVVGVPLAVLGISDSVWVAALLLAVSGAAKSCFDVASGTLLQRAVADRVLARVFGLREALLSAAIALGALLAPALVLVLEPTGAFVITGLLLPAVAALAWKVLKRLEAGAVSPGIHLNALRAVPFLRLAPLPALESLSRRVVEVSLGPGEVIVREGDLGDRFYVVLTGEVAVSHGGREVRRLGPGSSFGEIALVRESARTATVTAIGEVHLVAVGRHDFLTALGAAPTTRTAADQVAEAYLQGDRQEAAGD